MSKITYPTPLAKLLNKTNTHKKKICNYDITGKIWDDEREKYVPSAVFINQIRNWNWDTPPFVTVITPHPSTFGRTIMLRFTTWCNLRIWYINRHTIVARICFPNIICNVASYSISLNEFGNKKDLSYPW